METTDTSKRKFLVLLTAMFAAPIIISALSMLVIKCMPPFMVNIGNHEQSLTRHILLHAIPTFIYIFIYAKLWSVEGFAHNRKYKAGLILLMITKLYSTIPHTLSLLEAVSPTALSLIHACAAVVGIVGLFMFINNSCASRRLRIFIKWSPFICLLANIFPLPTQLYTFAYTGINIIVFLIVYRMVCKEDSIQ